MASHINRADDLRNLTTATQALLTPDVQQPAKFYVRARKELQQLIKERSSLPTVSSTLHRLAKRVTGSSKTAPTDSVLNAKRKQQYIRVLKNWDETDAWLVLGQVLHERNLRECRMATIPGEVLSCFFGYFSTSELVSLLSVCKAWYNCIMADSSLWTAPVVEIAGKASNQDAELLGSVLKRAVIHPLRLSIVFPRKMLDRRQPLQLVLREYISSDRLRSLALYFRERTTAWDSLLLVNMPGLQDLWLDTDVQLPPHSVLPADQPFPGSRPTSLYLYCIYPLALGLRDRFGATGSRIPDCFTSLTHLTLYTSVNTIILGLALQMALEQCPQLHDLTIIWLMIGSDNAHRFWAGPPADCPLRTFRVALPSPEHELPHIVNNMRSTLPDLNLCIKADSWGRCDKAGALFMRFRAQEDSVRRCSAVFCAPVLPEQFTRLWSPPKPGVDFSAQVTLYKTNVEGREFYHRAVDGTVPGVNDILQTVARKGHFTNLVRLTVAEGFWDAVAGGVKRLEFLTTLEILVATRLPGHYKVIEYASSSPLVFGVRLEQEDVDPNDICEDYMRAPYRCACPALEVLVLAQDPHFAKATGERAVRIDAQHVVQFIRHQLRLKPRENRPLKLVLQRVELRREGVSTKDADMLGALTLEESVLPFVHENVERRWDRSLDSGAACLV